MAALAREPLRSDVGPASVVGGAVERTQEPDTGAAVRVRRHRALASRDPGDAAAWPEDRAHPTPYATGRGARQLRRPRSGARAGGGWTRAISRTSDAAACRTTLWRASRAAATVPAGSRARGSRPVDRREDEVGTAAPPHPRRTAPGRSTGRGNRPGTGRGSCPRTSRSARAASSADRVSSAPDADGAAASSSGRPADRRGERCG